jgi:ABC-type Co2+ transport system permease subunit
VEEMMATSQKIKRETQMALVDVNKLGTTFVAFGGAFLLGMPFIGMVGSLVFGVVSIICALTKTDSWLNVFHAIAGFLGYWAVILLISQLPKMSEGLLMWFVMSSIYSFIWIIWMRKTTKVMVD